MAGRLPRDGVARNDHYHGCLSADLLRILRHLENDAVRRLHHLGNGYGLDAAFASDGRLTAMFRLTRWDADSGL